MKEKVVACPECEWYWEGVVRNWKREIKKENNKAGSCLCRRLNPLEYYSVTWKGQGEMWLLHAIPLTFHSGTTFPLTSKGQTVQHNTSSREPSHLFIIISRSIGFEDWYFLKKNYYKNFESFSFFCKLISFLTHNLSCVKSKSKYIYIYICFTSIQIEPKIVKQWNLAIIWCIRTRI